MFLPIRPDNRTKSVYHGIMFQRYSLEQDFEVIRLRLSTAHAVTHRRSQRQKNFFKSLNGHDLNLLYWKVLLQHEKDLTYPQQYPQQPYPPAQQAPPMPSPQEMWATIQRLQNEAAQNAQAVQEYQKKERQATFRIRRAKASGNLSLNWGPENIQGAYLTPIKYQDGRCFASASGAPATYQVQNTPQGPVIVCTIQNGPLNPEELQLWDELFLKPVSVIPARRGPQRSGQQTPNSNAPAPTPQAPLQPQQQTQFPAQPQYAQYPTQAPLPAPIPQYQGVPGGATASIAHLPKEVQDSLVQDATLLLQRAPQVYTSMDQALIAAKRAKNIP